MIGDKEFQEMLLAAREKNKKNPNFKSKMAAMIERRELSNAGKFLFVSEKYFKSSEKVKKILRSLSQACARLKDNKKDKRLRAIFYSLNEKKRAFGLRSLDIPGQLENEVRSV